MNIRLPRPLLAVLVALPLCGGSAVVSAHGDEPHGDHDAHHGGFVMMYEDIHFEVAAPPSGGIQVYYTNAARVELPAATVSDVVVEIVQPGGATEALTMTISAGGDYWEGSSAPLVDAAAVVRVGFLYEGQPLMLDVPATALLPEAAPAAAMTADAHAGH